MTPIQHKARVAVVTAAAAAVIVVRLLLGAGEAQAVVPASASTGTVAAIPAAAIRADDKKVKYYVVAKLPNGEPEFLFSIAERTLGDGNRFKEIFELNKGRLQPDGTALRVPTSITEGWILQLPPDARGPGVKEGALPTKVPAPGAEAPATVAATQPSAVSTAAPATADSSTGSLVLMIGVGCALVVGAAAGTLMLRRRSPKRPVPSLAGAAAFGEPTFSATTPEVADDPFRQSMSAPPFSHSMPASPLPQTAALPTTTAAAPPVAASSRAPRSVAPRSATPRQIPGPEPEPVPEPEEIKGYGRPVAGPRAAVSVSAVAGTSTFVPIGALTAGTTPRTAARPAEASPAARRTPARRGGPAQMIHVEFGDDLVEVGLGSGYPSRQDTSVAWMPVPYEVPEGGAAFVCIGSAEHSGCLFLDLAQAPGPVAVTGDRQAAHRLLESIVLQLSASPVLEHACATVVGPLEGLAEGLDHVERVPALTDLVSRREEEVDPPFEFVFCALDPEEGDAALVELLAGPGRVIPIVLGDTDSAEWRLRVEPRETGSDQ
ncbi:hypothetical protein [Streptomyces sp. NPDC005125]